MTTMLERAARSVREIDQELTCDEAEEFVRAVLMAVRDLPTELISKQRGQLYRTEFLDSDFTTMIDAILADGEGR